MDLTESDESTEPATEHGGYLSGGGAGLLAVLGVIFLGTIVAYAAWLFFETAA